MKPLARRSFIQGLLATVALPVAGGSDGISLTSMAHPLSGAGVAADLNEASLVRSWAYMVKGLDAFGNPIEELFHVRDDDMTGTTHKEFQMITVIYPEELKPPRFTSRGR